MPSNPMQRKVRNSFIAGIFVMLLIVLIVGAAVFFLIVKPKMDKAKEEEQQIAYVYRLKKGFSVSSGQEITSNMVEEVEIPITTNTTDFFQAKRQGSDGKLTSVAFAGGYTSKVDLVEGTILTKSILNEADEEALGDSTRYVEYNVVTIPTTLEIGDFIDIRLRLPNTHDLIVVSKKEIMNIYDNTIGLNLAEEDILILNSAIVETFVMNGSAELYLAKYVEPGMQEKATYTYSPTAQTVELIQNDPNIVTTAREAIATKYANSGTIRNPINSTLSQYSSEDIKNNIELGIRKQIEDAKNARESYLSELEGN